MKPEVHARLADLEEFGLLDHAPATLLARITVVDELADAVRDAALVQECAPERIDLKRDLFAQLDALAPADAVLASSSSALVASSFADVLPGRERCLVAHPGNPPYLIPVIEIVPAPFTSDDTTRRALARFMKPPACMRCVSPARSRVSSSTGYRALCCRKRIASCVTGLRRLAISIV